MNSVKIQKQPQGEVVGPKSLSGGVNVKPCPALSQDRIRIRAYELYENRGRERQDQQDWIDAEQELLHEAIAARRTMKSLQRPSTMSRTTR